MDKRITGRRDNLIRRRHRRLAMTLGLGGVIAAIIPAAAFAQQTAVPADPVPGTAGSDDNSPARAVSDGSPEPTGQFDDIVVTAQRRSENLQRVPISAQVVGQQAIAQQNLTSIASLSQIAPSIHVQASGRSNNFYIRGTGSGESQSFDQSVGTYIDDIYHGRSRYSDAIFLDLDHVEILKGPQSTFFGNNSIAGAFNIVTKKPGRDFGGWARALISPTGGSNNGQYAVEGGITLPVSDTLSVRASGIVSGQRGELRNLVTGKYAANKDNYAFRGTLRYEPSSDFDVTLKGEIGRSLSDGGLILRQASCPPPAPIVATGFCAINLANKTTPSLRSNTYTASDGNQTRLHTYEGVLTMNYQLGAATLTSVTGYNGYRYLLDLDNDATDRTLLNVRATERYHQFSQELRIASPTNRTIEYLAGLYYQSDRLDTVQQVSYFFLTPNLSAPPPFAPLRPFLPLGQIVDAAQPERVYSAFGSLTWNASDRLKIIGGLRGSIVRKRLDWELIYGTAAQNYGGIVPLPANLVPLANAIGLGTAGTVDIRRKDKALMPSVKLQYQFDRTVMAYASYSRGFKAGGFSFAELSANPVNYPFAPEHVNAYEIGLKSELADRTVILNLAAFRNDFSDLQVVIQGQSPTGALINFVRNAAASRSQGIELEARWVVSPVFRLTAEGTYLDSKYRTYRNAGATYFQQLAGIRIQDLSGRPTLYAPKWSGNVSGTLTVPVSDNYVVTAEAIGILSSRYEIYSTLDPLTTQRGYGRLDARLSFDSVDGRWGVDLIGRNLTNTIIRTTAGYQPTSFGSLYLDRQQLRNVALQLRYKF